MLGQQGIDTRADKRSTLTLLPTEQENLLTRNDTNIYKIYKCKRYTIYIERKLNRLVSASLFLFSILTTFPIPEVSEYKIRHAKPQDEI